MTGRLYYENATRTTKAAARTQDADVFGEMRELARVKKTMTPEQLALGNPIVNRIGIVLVPVPAGEFRWVARK